MVALTHIHNHLFYNKKYYNILCCIYQEKENEKDCKKREFLTVEDFGKSEFVGPINNVQCTIYNRADVAIQAVIANHCTL